MVDSHLPVSGQQLRAHFAQKAVLPQKEVSKAETFLTALESRIATGAKPSKADIKSGEVLLKTLEDQTALFEFNFAQLVAQEASSDDDIDAKIDAVGRGLEQAQTTTDRLRDTLRSFR